MKVTEEIKFQFYVRKSLLKVFFLSSQNFAETLDILSLLSLSFSNPFSLIFYFFFLLYFLEESLIFYHFLISFVLSVSNC